MQLSSYQPVALASNFESLGQMRCLAVSAPPPLQLQAVLLHSGICVRGTGAFSAERWRGAARQAGAIALLRAPWRRIHGVLAALFMGDSGCASGDWETSILANTWKLLRVDGCGSCQHCRGLRGCTSC